MAISNKDIALSVLKGAFIDRDPGVVEVEQAVYGQPVIVPSRFTTMPAIQILDSGIVAVTFPVVIPRAP